MSSDRKKVEFWCDPLVVYGKNVQISVFCFTLDSIRLRPTVQEQKQSDSCPGDTTVTVEMVGQFHFAAGVMGQLRRRGIKSIPKTAGKAAQVRITRGGVGESGICTFSDGLEDVCG